MQLLPPSISPTSTDGTTSSLASPVVGSTVGPFKRPPLASGPTGQIIGASYDVTLIEAAGDAALGVITKA
jgi:hypothetical protein